MTGDGRLAGDGHVRVAFSDLDANGGDGITWAIDVGAVTLKTLRLPN